MTDEALFNLVTEFKLWRLKIERFKARPDLDGDLIAAVGAIVREAVAIELFLDDAERALTQDARAVLAL